MRLLEGAAGVPPASSLWRTPTPYILLVIGLMMFLIALVLFVLLCARNSRRSRRGGSDDEDSLDNPPDQIGPAVKLLAETSDMLKKSVEKSSRLVIPAAVIRHSNELIEIIKRIRNIQQP